MIRILEKSRAIGARAARAYLSGESVTWTTRRNPAPRSMSIAEVAAIQRAPVPLTKKYIYKLKAGRPLPSTTKRGGQPPARMIAEERTLIAFIRIVVNSAFGDGDLHPQLC